MSGLGTLHREQQKQLDANSRLNPHEVDDTVPASTTPSHASTHSPPSVGGGRGGGGGQEIHDKGEMRREISENRTQDKNLRVNPSNLVLPFNEKSNIDKRSKSENGSKEEIENENATEIQEKVDSLNVNSLPPTPENIATDNSNLTTHGNKTDESVKHILSFHVTEQDKNQDLPPPTDTPSTQLNQTVDATPSRRKSKVKNTKNLGGGKDGKDSDSSVCSRKRSSKSKTKIKSKFTPGSLEYIEERLCGRIFSGWVDERQWVESVGGYRDVIEVDEWEAEMNHQLQAIVSSIQGVQEGTKWINITPPGTGPYYCLWVLLEVPPTPGHYWYTITQVKLQPQFGLMISVKEIRSIHPHDGELAAARRTRLKKASQGGSRSELESMSDAFLDWTHNLSSLRPATVLSSITSTLTLSNIKETIRFVIVLLMTLVIGLAAFVRESHIIGLRFIREAGIFFNNATPFMQTVLAFFEKIFGGFYLLLAMVYRDFRRPSAPPPHYPPPPPPLTPNPPPPRPPTGPRAIQYVSPERWVVKTQNNEFT